jgi:hypothetical protein
VSQYLLNADQGRFCDRLADHELCWYAVVGGGISASVMVFPAPGPLYAGRGLSAMTLVVEGYSSLTYVSYWLHSFRRHLTFLIRKDMMFSSKLFLFVSSLIQVDHILAMLTEEIRIGIHGVKTRSTVILAHGTGPGFTISVHVRI